MTQTTEGWWQHLYDDIVAEMFLVRKDPEELQATIRFLVRCLELEAGSVVFDQCCGIGSLAIPLAGAGYRVIGVDQSAGYIERARAAAPAGDFHAADAIAFVAPEPCDAAFNWGTGFGNADDVQNLGMLRRVYETLKPGGWFALDYQHVPRVLRDFRACQVHRHASEPPGLSRRSSGETLLVRESQLDLSAGLLRQTWTFIRPDGGRDVRHTAVRLYLPDALAALLVLAGFDDIAFHGGVRGEPLTLDSPRCILTARKPT